MWNRAKMEGKEQYWKKESNVAASGEKVGRRGRSQGGEGAPWNERVLPGGCSRRLGLGRAAICPASRWHVSPEGRLVAKTGAAWHDGWGPCLLPLGSVGSSPWLLTCAFSCRLWVPRGWSLDSGHQVQGAWLVSFASSGGRLFARDVPACSRPRRAMFLLFFLEVPSGQSGVGVKSRELGCCYGHLTHTHLVARWRAEPGQRDEGSVSAPRTGDWNAAGERRERE